MDKTIMFKDKELRVTDTLIEVDSSPMPYDTLDAVTYKQGLFGVKGELRFKPRDGMEETLFFNRGVNKQVREIAVYAAKHAGVALTQVRKGRSKLPFLLIPLGLLLAAAIILIVIYLYNGDGDDGIGGDSYDPYGSNDYEMNDEYFPNMDFELVDDILEDEREWETQDITVTEDETEPSVAAGPLTVSVLEERVNALFESAGSEARATFDWNADSLENVIACDLGMGAVLSLRVTPEDGVLVGVTYVWEGGSESFLAGYLGMTVTTLAAKPDISEEALALVIMGGEFSVDNVSIRVDKSQPGKMALVLFFM